MRYEVRGEKVRKAKECQMGGPRGVSRRVKKGFPRAMLSQSILRCALTSSTPSLSLPLLLPLPLLLSLPLPNGKVPVPEAVLALEPSSLSIIFTIIAFKSSKCTFTWLLTRLEDCGLTRRVRYEFTTSDWTMKPSNKYAGAAVAVAAATASAFASTSTSD